MPEVSAEPEKRAEQVLKTAWLTANASVGWFTRVSDDGKCLVPDFTHCTEQQLACIESVDVVERIMSEEVIDRRIRFKLKDSVKALALLGRVIELDRKEMEIPSDLEKLRAKLRGIQNNVQINVVYEDRPGSRVPVVKQREVVEGQTIEEPAKVKALEGKGPVESQPGEPGEAELEHGPDAKPYAYSEQRRGY